MSNNMDKKINNDTTDKNTDKNTDTTTDKNTDTIKNEKKFAKTWDKAFNCDKNMDEDNKKALNVMKTEGMDAAVKHMFTDQKTGGQLSYFQMRMRYG